MTAMLASTIRQERAALGKGGRVTLALMTHRVAWRHCAGQSRLPDRQTRHWWQSGCGRLACLGTAASAVTATAAGTWS